MTSERNWVLQIDPPVAKVLKKIPRNTAKRIATTIENLPTNPYGGDIQKMKGEKHVWRRRIGEYRIFFEIIPEQSILHVFHVERRTSTTY